MTLIVTHILFEKYLDSFRLPVVECLCHKLGMQQIHDLSITNEFSLAEFGDQRLTKRLVRLAQCMANQPNQSIPAAAGNWGQACGAYRFLDNQSVSPAAILAAHSAQCVQRVAPMPVMLAVNDTTSLNYSGHLCTRGLGLVNNKRGKTRGLFLHSLLAFSPEEQPLGLLDMQFWARDPSTYGINHQRNSRPIEQKESFKWLRCYQALQAVAAETPNTRWVYVGDREADLYELFELAQAESTNPAVLARIQHDRGLEGSSQRLFARLASAPEAGQIQVRVPRRPGRAARTATVTIRFCPVQISAPLLKKQRPGQQLWAVEAIEQDPPAKTEPLHWRLLTTLPVEDLAAAVEKVRWYSVRWAIEVFHKVLKSGFGVETAQLQSAQRLQRYVTIKAVLAWRVMAMTYLGRTRPDGKLGQILVPEEWQVLKAVMKEEVEKLTQEPTVSDVIRWVGRLGGHLGRRGDGDPGPLTLARGLQRLADLTAGWNQAMATIKCA